MTTTASYPTQPGWWWRHMNVDGATSYHKPVPVFVHAVDLTGVLWSRDGRVVDDGWWVAPLIMPDDAQERARLAVLGRSVNWRAP